MMALYGHKSSARDGLKSIKLMNSNDDTYYRRRYAGKMTRNEQENILEQQRRISFRNRDREHSSADSIVYDEMLASSLSYFPPFGAPSTHGMNNDQLVFCLKEEGGDKVPPTKTSKRDFSEDVIPVNAKLLAQGLGKTTNEKESKPFLQTMISRPFHLIARPVQMIAHPVVSLARSVIRLCKSPWTSFERHDEANIRVVGFISCLKQRI
jgi:hypothetical protein